MENPPPAGPRRPGADGITPPPTDADLRSGPNDDPLFRYERRAAALIDSGLFQTGRCDATKHADRRAAWAAAWVLIATGPGIGCTGGSESVISGVGNGGNRIGTAALWESVADELAHHEATPTVTDEDVQRVFEVIRSHAREDGQD